MAAPTLGFGSAVALAAESTYGTAATRTRLLKVQSHRCRADIGIEEVPTLGDHTNDSANPVEFVKTLVAADGQIVFPLLAEDQAVYFILAYIFGKVTDSGSGPSSYVHTYELANVVRSLVAMSCEHRHGSGDSKLMHGCVPTRTTITIEAGRPVMVTCDYLAEEGGALATKTTLSHFTGGEFLLGPQGSVMAWNSVSHQPIRIVITIDHKMGRRYVVGSLVTLQPIVTGPTEIMIEADLEHGVLTDPEAAYVAETTGDLTFTLTSGGGETFAFTAFNAQIVRAIDRVVGGYGIIGKSVTWRAKADAGGAGDEGLKLVVSNSSIATYDAV